MIAIERAIERAIMVSLRGSHLVDLCWRYDSAAGEVAVSIGRNCTDSQSRRPLRERSGALARTLPLF
jgi:hypothetical protein